MIVNFILTFCHSSESGGHFGPKRTAHKVLECGFYQPSIFRDTYEFCKRCEACQKTGYLSRRNQNPLHNVYVCEIFDLWGVDLMGSFSPSFGFTYILMLVDYVSNWIEVVATRAGDVKTMANMLNLSFCTNVEFLRQSSITGEHIFVIEPQAPCQPNIM